LHHVALLVAVRQAADRSVVARGEDRALAHQHRADVLAIAGGAGGDDLRHVHEVHVPGSALLHGPAPCLAPARGAASDGDHPLCRRARSRAASLLSLAPAGAIPAALSRHAYGWHTRLFAGGSRVRSTRPAGPLLGVYAYTVF